MSSQDTNTPIPILLKGGPCDGRRVTGERGPDFPLDFKCKGVDYQYTGRNTKSGRYIYRPYHVTQPPGPPGVQPGHKKSRAHESWHQMLRTIFVEAPKELKHAYNARAAIRRLRHRPGLR